MQGFRFVILLVTLVLLVLGIPLARLVLPSMHPVAAQVALGVLLVAMLSAAVFAVSEDRRTTLIAVVLALPAVVSQGLDSVIDHEGLLALSSVCDIVFLGYVIAVVLRHLFVETKVTANMICASLCVYLLLGVVWADAYSLIDIVEGGAFFYSLDELPMGETMRFRGQNAVYPIYFSLVTMTTLGYGDIVPYTALSRAFASIQAVVGQLYLAVLVARLVGLHISHSMLEQKGDRDKDP